MHQPFSTGHIEVISGCMFAGKTEELIRRLRRADIAGQSIQVFSPEIDNRYDVETIGSHNGQDWDATVIATDESGVETLKDAVNNDVVAVDEFNFFTSDFIRAIEHLADNDVRVILSGTDQTFRGDVFDPMGEAMAVSDSVDKLSAVCEVCGKKATKNQRLIEGRPAPADAPTIMVGGNESYEARCRECFVLPVESDATVTQTESE